MKHFKAFLFLISFLFTFAAARDLAKAKAKTLNLDVKTVANPGVGGVPETRPIGNGGGLTNPGFGNGQFYGSFPGLYGGGLPSYGSGRYPGDVISRIFPGGFPSGFPGYPGSGFPGVGGGYRRPGYGAVGRGNCQFGCCQYIGYRCMMCCGY